MFLSGLDNISFGGLGLLSGSIPPTQAADIVWQNMPFGTTEFTLNMIAGISLQEFKQKIASALSDKYQMVSSSTPPDNVVSDDILIAASPKNGPTISAALNSMRSNGYYIVKVADVQASSQPSSNSVLSSSRATSPSTQTATQSTPQSALKTGDFWSDISKDISSIVQGWPKAPKQLETRYTRVPYRQTKKDKQRLVWIVGGFGVLFAITMVVVASNSGD